MLPTGSHYVTVGRFENEESISPDDSWSIVIEFHEPPAYCERRRASARFLVSDAPAALMQEGTQFELLEGRRVVAVGRVLSEPLVDEG